MLGNGNTSQAFVSYKEVPQFPYRIIEALLENKNEQIEDFWKLLKYADADALDRPNLTYDEKLALVWSGDSIEQKYAIFLKPMVGSAMDTAEAQTQMRLYRFTISPNSPYDSIICFEADFITNDKTCLVYKDGILCERTDLMESIFLDIMNGRDIKIGTGYVQFNKELSRTCNSTLTIGNSKTFYGRSLIFALEFVGAESGGECG